MCLEIVLSGKLKVFFEVIAFFFHFKILSAFMIFLKIPKIAENNLYESLNMQFFDKIAHLYSRPVVPFYSIQQKRKKIA